MRRLLVMAFTAVALAAAGCEGVGDVFDGDSDRDRERRPPPSKRDWDGPPVEADVVRLESYPEQWMGVARVTVPTGGHRLVLDDTRYENGRLQMFVSVVKPPRDAMVTQALAELTVQHSTGARRIDRLEVLARVVRQGQAPERHALAATAGR